ncbi:hypothetical protein HPP92_022703 [Vanilla planifolia]|uniref:LysM domain-containing protein n=1 Tax=Vanilla planifolia TaxID=51239 RepID=A0A835PSH3_VANPL|nr:hypothetical protein HPP92_022703 [Vanilla planifolia]
MRSAAFAFLLVAMFFVIPRPLKAAPFICNAAPRSTCQSLIGYVPPNDTTFAAVKSLFGVKSIRSLFSSNGLPPSSRTASRIAAGSTVRVPVPCACSSGSGSTSGRPVYVVKAGEGLDAIARNVFNGFVTYQEIATANNITDPNMINVGQRLLIPLPCSCDREGGESVVHYTHLVVPDSTVSSIADEFGVSLGLLLRINGITDPKTLQAGQVLDVPLRACSSTISNSSIDRNLLVPNGSYALTAKNCIQCRCSSTTWQLDCLPVQAISNSSCPTATCWIAFPFKP